MVDPGTVAAGSLILAIITAVVLRYDQEFNVPFIEAGLPMTILTVGAGYYVIARDGIQGILMSYSEGIIVAVVTSALTAFLVMDKNR